MSARSRSATRRGWVDSAIPEKNDDAVEGVILMLRGEQTQNVLKGVEAKTDELNRQVLPSDVKIHPYYDRSELVKLTTTPLKTTCCAGWCWS